MPFPVTPSPVALDLPHATQGTLAVTLRTAEIEDADTYERTWVSALQEKGRPDAAWPWREHIARALKEEGFFCLAAASSAALEALLSLSLEKGSSRLSPGQDLVYIEYVGVAPWNQPPPVGQKLIKGLGTFLVELSVRVSLSLGLQGRLGLHSKEEVESFYRGLGLRALERERTEDGTWLYFEAGPEEAEHLLKRGRR